VEKGRVEAFSDGVFAIAITLLVLVFLEQHFEEGNLGSELTALWPSYLAYVLTFFTIGITWVNHNAIFRHLAAVDRTLLYLNIALLVPNVFLPFPTQLLAEFIRTDDARDAALVYGCTMTVMALLFNAVWHYAAWGRRLLASDVDEREVSGITRSYAPGPIIYGLATLLAFASPVASAIAYGLIALVYVSTSIWGSENPAR
jgi:TMEM175 potassium channel family protein